MLRTLAGGGASAVSSALPVAPGDPNVPGAVGGDGAVGVPYYHRVLPIWHEAGHCIVKLIGSVPLYPVC